MPGYDVLHQMRMTQDLNNNDAPRNVEDDLVEEVDVVVPPSTTVQGAR